MNNLCECIHEYVKVLANIYKKIARWFFFFFKYVVKIIDIANSMF